MTLSGPWALSRETARDGTITSIGGGWRGMLRGVSPLAFFAPWVIGLAARS